MKFSTGDRTINLRGDPSLGKSCVSLKAMLRAIKNKGTKVLVELNQMGTIRTREEHEPEFLRSVL